MVPLRAALPWGRFPLEPDFRRHAYIATKAAACTGNKLMTKRIARTMPALNLYTDADQIADRLAAQARARACLAADGAGLAAMTGRVSTLLADSLLEHLLCVTTSTPCGSLR